MNHKKLEKGIQDLGERLCRAEARLNNNFHLTSKREPELLDFSPFGGLQPRYDNYEFKEVLWAILNHLGLRLNKTDAIPEKTVLEKVLPKKEK